MACDSGKTGIITLLMRTLLALEEDPSQPNHATFHKDPLVIVICPNNALEEDLVSFRDHAALPRLTSPGVSGRGHLDSLACFKDFAG